jgi:Protein of unknown function (DUF3024)
MRALATILMRIKRGWRHQIWHYQVEVARVKRALDSFMQTRRPPPHIRPKLDLGYRISGQSVEIFEIRHAWRGLPHERHESAVAKATFVRSRNVWRVFWQRRDLKWHGYEPVNEVRSIDDFLSVVAEDRHACFFG